MGPGSTSAALSRIASALESCGSPSRSAARAALRLVLILAEGQLVPKRMEDAFRMYLDDAIEDNAYVAPEDFVGYLDFLGLLRGEQGDPPFDWDELLEDVAGEYSVAPGPARGEWDVSPA